MSEISSKRERLASPSFSSDPLRTPPPKQTRTQLTVQQAPRRKSTERMKNILANQSLPMTGLLRSSTPIKQQQVAPTLKVTSNHQPLTENKINIINQKRKKVVESISPDTDGLQQLMEVEAWHEAIDLCGKLMKESSLPHEQLNLKFTSIICHIKSRQYRQAFEQYCGLGDLWDRGAYHYESHYDNVELYRTTGKRGSIVPFSLRVIGAELPSLLTPPEILLSLDRLFELVIVCVRNCKKLVKRKKKMMKMKN